MKRFLLSMALLLALCVPWTHGQTTPALTSYGFETGINSAKWVDISTGSTTLITNGGDSRASSVTNIGFTFSFGGTDYTQFSVNTDGNLRLGSTVTGTGYYTSPFTSSYSNYNNPKINAFGVDGRMGSAGYVKYKLTGTSPNQVLVVEFNTKPYSVSSSLTDDICWQVQLFETSNEAMIVYSATAPSTSTLPSTFQVGMCTSSTDVVTVNTSTNTVSTGATSTTNAKANWPAPSRYYRFYVPTCLKPTALTASNLTEVTADISWTLGLSETSWEYVYGETGFTPDWTNATTVATPNATLAGLAANTKYDFYVRSICSATDQSDPASFSFRTTCPAAGETITKQHHLTNDFEDVTTQITGNYYNIPDCWSKISTTSSTSTTYTKFPCIYNYASSAHAGSRCINFYQGSPTSTYPDPQILILPQVTNDVSGLRLKFWAKMNSSSYAGTLQVGVMTDPADATTFTQVGSDVTLTTTYAEYEIYLDTYTGSGSYVAIKCSKATSTSYQNIYLDDVDLSPMPTCFKPTGITVSGITNNQATLSWTPGSTETVWNLQYKKSSDANWTSVNVTTNPYTLNGLDANSTYTFKMQSDCSDEQSEWTNEATFKTLCDAVTPENLGTVSFETSEGFTTGYGNMANCWTVGNMKTTNTSYIPYVYTTYAHTGSNCMKIYAYTYSTSTNNDSAYAVMPPMLFDQDITDYQVKFWMRKYSTSTYSSYNDTLYVGILSDPSDMSTLQIVGKAVNATTTYNKYKVKFTNYTGGTTGYIVFLGAADPNSTTSSKYGAFYVDDVTVELQPECEELNSAWISDVKRRSATVNWDFNGSRPANCTGYEVKVSQNSDAEEEGDTTITLNNPDTASCTIDRLDREVTYYFHVRALCGTSSYSTWVTTSATTMGLNSCIASGTGTSDTNMPYSSYGSAYFQQIYTADELAAMGVAPGEIQSISYTWSANSSVSKNMTIWMGLTQKETFTSASDWEPASTFTQYYHTDAMTATSGTVSYTLSTPFVWDGTSNIIIATAINNGTNSGFTSKGTNCGANRSCYMYKDNYQYGIDPTVTSQYSGAYTTGIRSNVSFCQTIEACPVVTEVASSDITTNSATISWTQSVGDYANTCDLYYSSTQLTDPATEITTPSFQGISGTTQALTGLSQYTLYYIYVRANCNADGNVTDGNSDWVEHSFRTESACEYPRNVAATMTGKTTARISWTDKQGQSTVGNSYEYYVSTTNAEPSVAGTATTDGYADITGMTPEATYYCYARKVCGGDDGESPWIMDSVVVPPTLPAVLNVTASDISFNAFRATWNRDIARFANETAWEYCCVATGETPADWVAATDTFQVLSGLTENTTYDLYVRATDGQGNYSQNAMITVTTTARPSDCNTITDLGTTSSYVAPVYSNYGSAYSIAIYTASELEARGFSAGNITAISYYQKSCAYPSTANKYQKTTTVWMGNTTKSSFTDNSDWMATGLTEVKAAEVVDYNKVNDWVTLTLDNAFAWDGVSNIAVAVLANTTGSYTTLSFADATTSDNKTICGYTDSQITLYDGVPSSNYKLVSTNRPNIQFCFEPVACPKPTHLLVDRITTTSANASWYPGYTETSWNYYVTTETMTEEELNAAPTTATTSTVNALTGLTKDTDYNLYVRGNCSATDHSQWARTPFQTMPTCSAPVSDSCIAVNSADNEITFDAAPGSIGTVGTYDYRYWRIGTTDTTTVTGQNATYVASNVSGGDYDWQVRANCTGVDEEGAVEGASRWTNGNRIRVCGTYALPYTQGFEDVPTTYTGPGMIETICWNDLNASESTSSYPKYYAFTGQATEGTKSLEFFSSNTKSIYVILPQLDNVTDCRVRFDCTYESLTYSGTFQVGYITNAAADSTFVPVYTDTDRYSYQMTSHVAYLRNIPAGARLAFCYTNAQSDNYYGWLDNVIVDTIPVYGISSSVAPDAALGTVEVICNNPIDTVSAGRFYEATTASLKAVANEGFYFTHWTNGTGEYIADTDSLPILMAQDTSLVANFDTMEYDLTVVVDPAYASLGTVSGNGTFKYLTDHQISASPAEHYHVVWEDNNLDNPRTITMPAKDTTYTAHFDIDTFTVTVVCDPDSLGTSTGYGRYTYGSQATLTAVPNEHQEFLNWSNGERTETITIDVVSDTTLTAYYKTITHVVSAIPNNPAMGTITGAGEYNQGTMAVLTAQPSPNYHFVCWNNSATTPQITFNVDQDTLMVATFAINRHNVSATANDPALGRVTGDFGDWDYGTEVTLTATPVNAHSSFTGWSDGTTANPYTFTLVSDTTVNAIFALDKHILTVWGGLGGQVSSGGMYDHGDTAYVYAIPADHYHFAGWTDGNINPAFSIVMDQNYSFTAAFAIDRHVVTTNVNNTALGSVTGAGEYDYNATVTLTAVPADSHSRFTGWSNGSNANPLTFTLTGDTNITATFTVDTHDVTVNVNNSSMGTVSGAGNYVHGTMATVSATAADHYHFVNWSNGVTTPSFSFIVENDSTVTANFAIDRYNVTANVNNTALGSVSGTGEFDYNTQVTLTAVPADAHSRFVGWSNGSNVNPLTFTITSDTAFTAAFVVDSHTITATSSGHGQVSGSGTYTHGTVATLVATADADYHFVNWSNGATTNVISIYADRDSSVVANFAINQHAVTALSANNALGTVSGSGTYNHGATVNLTATPADAHCRFVNWSNGATTATISFTLTKDTTFTANFAVDQHTIAATANNAAMGTVTGAGTYTHGDQVTLVATPAANHHFINWSNGATSNVLNFIADQNYTLTANFAIDQYQITAISSDETMGTVSGSGTYNYGATVTLTATPAAHYHFVSWSNGETNTVITMSATADVNLVAYFEIDTYTVTANVVGEGYVFGAGSFEYGTTVTLYAIPDPGWKFDGWNTGEVSDTLTFVIDGDVTYTANFSEIPVEPTGVEDAEVYNYVAYTENLDIIINGVADHNVSVFDMAGRLVKTITNASAEERVTVQAAGVYLIRVDNFPATRVVVK